MKIGPLTPYAETIKLIIAVLVGCALLWGWNTVMDWREAAQVNERRGDKIIATEGIMNDGAKADADRADDDSAVSTGRETYHNAKEEAKRNEPETADRAMRTVPASVRNAFRARRLARERLDCAGDECQAGPATSRAAQR